MRSSAAVPPTRSRAQSASASTPACDTTPVTATNARPPVPGAPGAPGGSFARPAAQAARWPPALCPTATTRDAGTGSVASRSIPAATSSNVAGQPPPANARRYSRFQAAYPRAARSAASGCPRERSYRARQNPPWMITTAPSGDPPGSHSSPNWAGSAPYRWMAGALSAALGMLSRGVHGPDHSTGPGRPVAEAAAVRPSPADLCRGQKDKTQNEGGAALGRPSRNSLRRPLTAGRGV